MRPLYEITSIIDALLDRAYDAETGEVLDAELDAELDKLNADRDARALDIACAVVDYRAEAAKIAERAKVLSEWARSIDAKAERLERYIAKHIPAGHKLADDRVRVSWRKSERVVLDVDVASLPPRFQRLSVTAAVSDIKAELKVGDAEAAKVAHLETHHNLQVK